MMNDTLNLLRREVARTSQRRVAARIGVSAASINLVLSGTYPNPERMLARIAAVLSTVRCPFLLTDLPLPECQQTALGRAPTHNPLRMAHWRSCQHCPNRPQEGEDHGCTRV